MKKIFKSMAVIAAAILGITACEKPDNKEIVPPAEALKLSISNDVITLTEENASVEALNFSWTTGSNNGTGNAISYKLEIAPKAEEYAYYLELGQKVYSKSYKVAELNTLLTEELGAEAGVETEYKARISAIVAGTDDIQTSEVEFKATTYAPVPSALYLIGDATPNGWAADNATAMDKLSAGRFSWLGTLTKGSFRFITEPGKFWPGYVNSDGRLKYFAEDAGEEDKCFEIAENGDYKIEVNLLDNSIVITENNNPLYEHLWLVGPAAPYGWSLDDAENGNDATMNYSAENIYEYTWTGKLVKGELKFSCDLQKDWGGKWVFATESGKEFTTVTDEAVEIRTTDNKDYKWNVTTEGEYSITINVKTSKMTVTGPEAEEPDPDKCPYDYLWLVGSATDYGYSLDNIAGDDKYKMMPAADNSWIFTWEGSLKADELKISCDLQRDFGGDWFHPETADAPLTDGSIVLNGDDTKWKVGTAGNYKIIVDVKNLTITVENK
ncbi:MAG: SusF/SusE family outer membrane protein [Candidatus Cryptobacteroides sp.]